MNKLIKKMEIYKELQQYIAKIDPGMRLWVMGSKKSYNASEIVIKKCIAIAVSRAWLNEAVNTPMVIEYIKTSICHEFGHIKRQLEKKETKRNLVNDFLSTLIYEVLKMIGIDTRSINLYDNHYIQLWFDEFMADYEGYKIYTKDSSNNECLVQKHIFLSKMSFVYKKNEKSENNKREKSSHPTWPMRMYYIDKGIVPDFDKIKELYMDYYYSTKEREEFIYTYNAEDKDDFISAYHDALEDTRATQFCFHEIIKKNI